MAAVKRWHLDTPAPRLPRSAELYKQGVLHACGLGPKTPHQGRRRALLHLLPADWRHDQIEICISSQDIETHGSPQAAVQAWSQEVSKHMLPSVPAVWNRNRWLKAIIHLEITTIFCTFHRGLGSTVLARWARSLRKSKGEKEIISDWALVPYEADAAKDDKNSKDEEFSWESFNRQARGDTLRFTSTLNPDALIVMVIRLRGLVEQQQRMLTWSSDVWEAKQMAEVAQGKPRQWRLLMAVSGKWTKDLRKYLIRLATDSTYWAAITQPTAESRTDGFRVCSVTFAGAFWFLARYELLLPWRLFAILSCGRREQEAIADSLLKESACILDTFLDNGEISTRRFLLCWANGRCTVCG